MITDSRDEDFSWEIGGSMPDYVEQMKQYRWTCKRALNAHGIKSASEMLDEIPRDLGVDRYGEGGAVSALEHEATEVVDLLDGRAVPAAPVEAPDQLEVATARVVPAARVLGPTGLDGAERDARVGGVAPVEDGQQTLPVERGRCRNAGDVENRGCQVDEPDEAARLTSILNGLDDLTPGGSRCAVSAARVVCTSAVSFCHCRPL